MTEEKIKIDVALTLEMAGVTQYKLAMGLKVQPTQVWRWYWKINYPRKKWLKKLIAYFEDRDIEIKYVNVV